MVEILFVGTGDAFGSGGRRNSAILLRSPGQTLLLDCGPTTLLGLKDMGIDPREIDAIALSHFHGDHASGVPFILLDYLFENRRERPLDILGPQGTRERIERMNCIFGYDTGMERTYDLRYREFTAGQTLEAAGYQLTPFDAYHHPETRPHMLRVDSDDRAILFSGDTGWTDGLPAQVGDVNLFICECTMLEEGFEYHLSHERLCRERGRFTCDRTILTHLGSDMIGNLDRVQFETATDGLRLKV
jgi:ribonuclease BN (tRNA processing enzyme)